MSPQFTRVAIRDKAANSEGDCVVDSKRPQYVEMSPCVAWNMWANARAQPCVPDIVEAVAVPQSFQAGRCGSKHTWPETLTKRPTCGVDGRLYMNVTLHPAEELEFTHEIDFGGTFRRNSCALNIFSAGASRAIPTFVSFSNGPKLTLPHPGCL